MLSGDNGILKQAVIARDKTRGAEVQESVKLAAINNTSTGPNSIVIKYIDNYYRLVINDTTNYIVLEVNEITGRDVTYSLVVSGSVVVLQTSLGLESFFDNIISEYNPKMIVEGNEINLTPYINKLYDIYDVIILTGWELLEYDGKTATISLTIYGQTITWTGTI